MNEFGDELRYDGHVTDFNFPTLEPDDAEIMRENPSVFMNHDYFDARLPRRRHVVVTSVYHALFTLGFPVLRQLLDGYDQRLSLLMDELVEWAETKRYPGPFDSGFLCRFMASAWGNDHYLTSLVRYMLAAAALHPEESHRAAAPDGGDRRYVLSSAAALLPDLHDCPAILSAIAPNGEADSRCSDRSLTWAQSRVSRPRHGPPSGVVIGGSNRSPPSTERLSRPL
jgi:hypothetical protein